MISRETILRGFPIKPLGEVAEFLDSRRRPITASERIPGPYPYYGANGQQDSVADYIFDEPLILLAEDGGPFDQPDRGIAYAIEGKTWVNNHAHVLRPRDHARLRYLVRVLENYDVTPWITGSTRAKLTKAGAFKIQIPLPPLAEQQRIAEILDKADALRAKRRAALAHLDTLTQSIFLDMFGDPATNPKGFERSTIDLVSERVTDGEHLTPKRTTEGIKLLSARNIRDGYIDFENVDYISAAEHERIRKRCDPSPGDILISCSGTIGRVASVDTAEPFSLVRSAAMVRPKRSHLRKKFLAHYLRTPALKAQMLRRANASSQANLFQGQIRELPVLLPPLSQQDSFVVRVACLETLKAAHSASLKEEEALFASLQQRGFRGEL